MDVLLACCLAAVNLISDFEVDTSPIPGEFRLGGDKDEGSLVRYEEDLTWNRCLRLDFKKYGVGKSGKRFINIWAMIGGDTKTKGFPCSPSTRYAFSFEAKGSAPYAVSNFSEWDDKGRRKTKWTSIGTFVPTTNGWTVYKGTFETGATAKRVALGIGFWGDESSHSANFRHRPGDWLMIDKLYVSPEKPKMTDVGHADAGELKRQPVLLLSDANEWSAELPEFRDNVYDRAPRYPSEAKIRAEVDALVVDFICSGTGVNVTNPVPSDIWSGDMMQLFFDVPVLGDDLLQLAVAATGERWMNGREKNLDGWSASIDAHAERWSGRVRVPWKLLGMDGRPGNGSVLKFRLARQQRVIGAPYGSADPKLGNRRYRYGLLMDDSAWPFPDGRLRDKALWGSVVFGSLKPVVSGIAAKFKTDEWKAKAGAVDLADPGLAMAQVAAFKEADRRAYLSSRKFIVAQVEPDVDTSVPFVPDELESPNEKIAVRGAVNEHVPIALAVANNTERFEEYRVTVVRGWRWGEPEPQNERWRLAPGLESKSGDILPPAAITIRRGVVSRDSDLENHGVRYDILAKVNEISSVPVPANESGLVWIDFDLHGAKSGTYRGKLVVTPISGDRCVSTTLRGGPKIKDGSAEIEVSVEVLPFALREPSDLPLNGFRSAYNAYHFDFMKEYDASMYWVSPWHFRAKFNDDGTIAERTPLPYLAPHIRLIAENARPQPPMKKCMICYNSYVIFKDNLCPKSIKYDTPEFWRAYREWVKYIDDYMTANGLPSSDYTIEVFDEPNLKRNDAYEVERAIRETKAAVPAIHVTNTNGAKSLYDRVSPLVDNWIFSQYIFGDKKQMEMVHDFRKKEGRTLSMYACDTSMRLDLYRYYRLLPWKAAACRGDFVSLYHFFEIQPGFTFRQAPKGAVAYDTTEALVPSIRLENLRIGMTDIRYLRHLERLARGKPDSALSKEAQAFVEKSLWNVSFLMPHDREQARRFRERCIDYILRFGGKGSK